MRHIGVRSTYSTKLSRVSEKKIGEENPKSSLLRQVAQSHCSLHSDTFPPRGALFSLFDKHIIVPQSSVIPPPKSGHKILNTFTTILPVAALDIEWNSLTCTWSETEPRPLFVQRKYAWHYIGEFTAVALMTVPPAISELPELEFVRFVSCSCGQALLILGHGSVDTDRPLDIWDAIAIG